MRKFSSVQYQKQRLSIASPYSLEQPVRQLAPILSPALQSVPPDGDAQLEQAHLFGHTLDQISIFPPARHTPVFSDQGQQSTDMLPPQRSVQYVFSQALQEEDIVSAENHTGLPDALKDGVECLSGFSLDDVRVHYNSSEPDRVQALAYAQGTDIYVGPGQEEHLAHEAWHVVQQMQGRVRPTTQAKGLAMNDDVGLEREADVMGSKAVTGQSSEGLQDRFLGIAGEEHAGSSNSGNTMYGPPIQAMMKRWKPKDGSVPPGYEKVNGMAEDVDAEVDDAHDEVVRMLKSGKPRQLLGVSSKRYAYWLETFADTTKMARSTGYIIEDAATHKFKGEAGFSMQSTDEMAGTRPDVVLRADGVTGYLDITSSGDAGHIFKKAGNWGGKPYVVESLYPSINFDDPNNTPLKLDAQDMKLVEQRRKVRAKSALGGAQKALKTRKKEIERKQSAYKRVLEDTDEDTRKKLATGSKRYKGYSKDEYSKYGVELDLAGNIVTKTPEDVLRDNDWIFEEDDINDEYGL